MEGVAKLRNQEWQQRQPQSDETQRAPGAGKHPEAVFRGGAGHGQRGEQIAPHPEIAGRLLVREQQCNRGNQGGDPTSGPVNEHHDQRHAEDTPQAPFLPPGFGCSVGAECRDEPMAGRQVKCSNHAFKTLLPTSGRHGAAGGLARQRGEIEVRTAQLETGSARRVLGDQQLVAALPRARQRIRRLHVETPAAAHGAPDLVDSREAIVIEIQPQLAHQREPVVIGIGNAAAALDDTQLRFLVHAKGRKRAPVRRHVRLRWIDAICAFGRRDAQLVVGREAPDFLAGPLAATRVGPGQGAGDTGAARREQQGVTAGPHLYSKSAVAFQARW